MGFRELDELMQSEPEYQPKYFQCQTSDSYRTDLALPDDPISFRSRVFGIKNISDLHITIEACTARPTRSTLLSDLCARTTSSGR